MAVIAWPLLHTTIRHSSTSGTLSLSHDLCPLLHGALVVMVTAAMAIAAAAMTAM
jgi:hypothetical protein